MAKESIIIVDDEAAVRQVIEIMLRKEGYDARGFSAAADALHYLKENRVDLVISDIRMPGMGGLEFLKAVKEADPEIIVIMITAYASVDTAVEAMKAGAYDYFTKPFNVEEIKLHIKKALKIKRLETENRFLKKDLKTKYGFSNLIGASPGMVEIYDLIMNIAKTKANVFITGESGTGKELVARAIHYESDRRDNPFVAINCGAMPENLIESEIFGHQKGAFTGATSAKVGLAEQADGGTMFLDELTELPLHLQVKLLRFVQERSFRRVGSVTDISVDIRFIAATNKDAEAEVAAGRFREDLFYRLNVIRMSLPPLRERKVDIPVLAAHFMNKYNMLLGKAIKGIAGEAMKRLLEHDYSGNVRELENVIERAVTLEQGAEISVQSLPPYMTELKGSPVKSAAAPLRPMQGAVDASLSYSATVPPGGMDMERTVEAFEKALITDALKKCGGAKKKAGELLGLSFRSMRYKLSKYGISDD